MAAAKNTQITPRIYLSELPPGNQLALQTPAKLCLSQWAGTMSSTPVSRAQSHISLSTDADAEGEPDPFHWRLGSELPHLNPSLESPAQGKATDIGVMVFDLRIVDFIKESTEGVMAPESQICNWDSVPDVLGTIAHSLAGVRDHMIVDVMDKDLRHDHSLWKYANVCITDERLSKDDYQPGKDPQVAEDVSPLVMISCIIGEINQLWTSIVDTSSHNATLFGPVIKEVTVAHTVIKQYSMLERYALLETGFFAEATKALGLTSQGVPVTIPEFFKDLVAKVDYVKEGVKFVSNQVVELQAANGTYQVPQAPLPPYTTASNQAGPSRAGKRKAAIISVDKDGKVIDDPSLSSTPKCSKTMAVAGSPRIEPPTASGVPATFTVEQVAASTPLVLAASQVGITLEYPVALALISKFDFVDKGTLETIKKTYGVTSINAVPIPTVPVGMKVPKGGLQSTLDGRLYSAKATKAVDKTLTSSSKTKAQKIEKVKAMPMYLHAPKDHAKLMRMNFRHQEQAPPKCRSDTELVEFMDSIRERLELDPNPITAARWLKDWCLDIVFKQRP